MAKSEYLETLEKLQNALTQFDMSFSVSNRIFRLALVSEILDTVCLFEQLYDSWSEYLPFGEGPDADVDFAYWKDLSSWDTLLNSAKQNACIDDFPLDMGNGMTSDRTHDNRRKFYLKTVNSVLRHSKYAGKDPTSTFVKTINSDKTHMITFGNMVFDALSSLLLVFSKIETLLSNPPQELFLNFYEMQYNRFCDQWLYYRNKIVEILHEELSDKRKCNKFYALKDEVWKSLYESSFLDALKDGINIYDIEDYRKEHPDTDKTENEIREVLALEGLVDNEYKPYKEKVGKYIFEHRKSLTYKDICTFFIYLDAIPNILKQIEILKEDDCNPTITSQSPADKNNSKTGQVNPVVEAIKEQTEVLKIIAEKHTVQIDVQNGAHVQISEQGITNQYLQLPKDVYPKVNNEGKDSKPAQQKKKVERKTNNKPQTLKYYTYSNEGVLKKQKQRVLIVFRLFNKWNWIDDKTTANDFDAFFTGEPRHCNITWTANTTILTILLQKLLEQPYIEKQTGLSEKSLVEQQFDKTPNWDRKRIVGDAQTKIDIVLYILNTKNVLDERKSGIYDEEADIQEAFAKTIVEANIKEGQLRSTKGI